MSTAELRAQEEQTRDRTRSPAVFLPPILFTLFYFVNVYLRASQKYFWFDELITLDLCRLPLHTIWEAIRHGIDFNPPLFFIVTKLSEGLFGENLIGLRVPEIAGFWVLCLCLYRVVNRHAGPLAGSIAMVLPTVTAAFFYAYEARPHAIVLGFCGLALVCWQMTVDKPSSRTWLVAFSVCLMGAFMLHCYAILVAVPFAVVELLRIVRFRRIYWPMWFAMAVPAFLAGLLYVPLLFSYRSQMKGTDYATLFPPSIGAVTDCYLLLISPCIFIILAWSALLAAERVIAPNSRSLPKRDETRPPIQEIIVGATFLLIPVLGVLLGRLVHGPFFARYFTSTVLGICLLMGLGASARRPLNWVAAVLASLLICSVLWNFAALVWHRHRGIAEKLSEPSTGFHMNSTLGGPLSNYKALTSMPSDSRPIAVLNPLDYLYLLHYAPEIRPRLYYIQGAVNDAAYSGFHKLHQWAPFSSNRELTKRELLELAPRSLVYGMDTSLKELAPLVQAGGTIAWMQFSDNHFLADLEVNRERSR